MLTKALTVVETQGFIRGAEKIWNEAERVALIDYMALNPEVGVVIPGTGGIRKLRWGRTGVGKRGGARIIYFYYAEDVPLYLLAAFAKARAEDVGSDEKRGLIAFAAGIKAQYASKGTRR